MKKFLAKTRRPDGKKRKGFTLTEVLIAASIFTIVSLIGINVFVNVIRIQRRVALENAIYEDGRVMMERISREIRSNTVDYEEYYNKASDFDSVSFGTLPGLDLYGPDRNPYGNRYGCYAKRFYNPGSGGPEVGDFGAYCNDGVTNPEDNPGCIVDKTTLDINTGQNPYAGYHSGLPSGNSDVASAFCDENQAPGGDTNCKDGSPNHNEQPELYLINSKGTEKTILARKEIVPDGSEHALALLRLTGQDNDKDGVAEVWRDDGSGSACPPGNPFCCSTGFTCTDPFSTSSLENTLKYDANLYKGFVPISPTRTDVVALKFIVAPLEDPRKAFAETEVTATNDIPQQPHVTIILTVKPAQSTLAGFTGGDVPVITLQTTVTSRVYNEVKSYYTKLGVDGVCEDYVP